MSEEIDKGLPPQDKDAATVAPPAPEPPPEAPHKWAIVGDDGTLAAVSDAPWPGAVKVPADFDLPIGKYRFVNGAFMPIPKMFPKTQSAGAVPDAKVALALFLRSMKAHGFPIPRYTAAFLRSMEEWPDDIEPPGGFDRWGV